MNDAQEIFQIGLRLHIPLQLLDGKPQLELVVTRPVGAARSVRLATRREQTQDRLERIRHRELTIGPPVHLADRRPPGGCDEVARGSMLEQPGGIAKQ